MNALVHMFISSELMNYNIIIIIIIIIINGTYRALYLAKTNQSARIQPNVTQSCHQ